MIPTLITLRNFDDQERGALTVADALPFDVRRAFFMRALGSARERGGHAHRVQQQILISAGTGVDDAVYIRTTQRSAIPRQWKLTTGGQALHIPPMVWVEILLSPESTLLVLASDRYDENEMIRDPGEWREAA